MYSLKTKTGNRAWYVAGIKTGSQTMRSIMDINCKNILAIAGSNWHASATEIYQHESFTNRISLLQPESDFLWTTTRNPWERHYSNYLYQKEKLIQKINFTGTAEEYDKKYPDSQFVLPHGNEMDVIKKMVNEHLDTFESYITTVEQQSNPVYYTGTNKPFNINGINFGAFKAFWTMSKSIECNGTVFMLDINDHNGIIDFIYQNFGLALTMIPRMNSKGHGKDYKQHYNTDLIDRISALEAPIIRAGNYKYS